MLHRFATKRKCGHVSGWIIHNVNINSRFVVRRMQIIHRISHEVTGVATNKGPEKRHLGGEYRNLSHFDGCSLPWNYRDSLSSSGGQVFVMEENPWCDERCGECCGSSRFESMLRLMMFLEAELEFKEEVIDLLLVSKCPSASLFVVYFRRNESCVVISIFLSYFVRLERIFAPTRPAGASTIELVWRCKAGKSRLPSSWEF